MSEALIRFTEILNKNDVLLQMRQIFFESSSKKTFRDQQEKESFYQKYMGEYLDRWPQLCWVAISDQVLGYILGAPETQDENLIKLQPHLECFRSDFRTYPAHLHINCHFDARGQGTGGRLLQTFEDNLRKLGITGLHLMTSPDSPNVRFYQRHHFDYSRSENFNGSSILLMGKRLNA